MSSYSLSLSSLRSTDTKDPSSEPFSTFLMASLSYLAILMASFCWSLLDSTGSSLNKTLDRIPTVLPKTTVVNMTRASDVVTITDLFGDVPSILSTRPKAMAPLIIPAYQMNNYSFMSTVSRAPSYFITARSPIVPRPLPTSMIANSTAKRCGDHTSST